MGGFHLSSPDYPQGFPVNAAQLFYFIKHGHVEFPEISSSHIMERSTMDTLAK
jgi:hypothetical protein